jgi:hypothetical protein
VATILPRFLKTFLFSGNKIPKEAEMTQNRHLIPIPFILLCALTVLAAGCGGGSSSDASGDDSSASVVSRGIITGFGSVYVNDTRYRTEGTRFSIDDDEGAESDLKVGMIVTVRGKTEDRYNGIAQSITYDNELKGPVSAITPDPADATRKTLTILGQAVLVDANTTIDDDGGLTFDTIALNDVLEVSGYVTSSGLTATHIELQDNELEIEIKGRIENLTGGSFDVRGFPVSYDGSTELDDIAELVEGLFVEVEGRLDGAGTTLLARKIEAEHEGLDGDMDEAEIKGVITDFNPDDLSFMLQGQRVDASGARLEPATLKLADGITVEASGKVIDGVLIAWEVEQKGRKIEIRAPLSAVDTDSETVRFNFNSTDIVVRVNRQTEIEDDESDRQLQLNELVTGDFVEMKAFADGSGVINAVEIERESFDGIRIAAPLDSFDGNARTVVLLGVEFDLFASRFEDESGNSLDADQFFDRLVSGRFIQIDDEDGNAVFEKAELDD